ncbi:cytochrome c oxidase assembly protein [Arthrobacter sp. ZGTC412]|uniref:cytochrome c oxidase assembly protein n=1 Tax=Arthrobacter sp. ZGTC412 TaxID=2058900 RepID=UPI0015E34A2B|nr:cytochrome c oxidase assembly protein [Arthrobacter sp. ZGTC412]
MIQLELLILAAPALLAFAWIGRGGRGLKSVRNTDLSASAAILSTVALPMVALAWHVPSIDAAVSGTGLSALVRPASFLVCGLALWGFAVHRPSDGRSMTGGRMLLLAYGASSLIGIAMILGPAPLMSSDHPGGLLVNSLTDQRLAGLVMMLADILVVFPALRKWLSDARSVPGLSRDPGVTGLQNSIPPPQMGKPEPRQLQEKEETVRTTGFRKFKKSVSADEPRAASGMGGKTE